MPPSPKLPRRDLLTGLAVLLALAACGAPKPEAVYPGETPEMDALVAKYAAIYQMPESLIHRVIRRESGYNPKARNGPYWGLMQIRHDTAKGLGYRGPARGLLDADTNLKYACAYLANAYTVAEHNADRAIRLYASGYYYEARRKGLLDQLKSGEAQASAQ